MKQQVTSVPHTARPASPAPAPPAPAPPAPRARAHGRAPARPRAPQPAAPCRPPTVGLRHGRLRHLGSGTASRSVASGSSGWRERRVRVVLRVSVEAARGRGPEKGRARGPHGNGQPPRGCGPAGLPAPRRRTASTPTPGRDEDRGRRGEEGG